MDLSIRESDPILERPAPRNALIRIKAARRRCPRQPPVLGALPTPGGLSHQTLLYRVLNP